MPTPSSNLRSVIARPRWSLDDARQVLAAMHSSGKSVAEFSAEHGLDAQRVYVWRRRLNTAIERRQSFEEVVVGGSGRRSVDVDAFEISLRSGHTLRVPASFDAFALERLLDVLARAGAC
jgi:transposase-like protein